MTFKGGGSEGWSNMHPLVNLAQRGAYADEGEGEGEEATTREGKLRYMYAYAGDNRKKQTDNHSVSDINSSSPYLHSGRRASLGDGRP